MVTPLALSGVSLSVLHQKVIAVNEIVLYGGGGGREGEGGEEREGGRREKGREGRGEGRAGGG